MNLSHGHELIEHELTERIIGLAIEVHRHLGPGLLESAYEECLAFELQQSGIECRRQVALPVVYKDIRLDCGYRMNIVAGRRLIIEVKAVERILPIHEAQILTYLRLSRLRVALLINFNISFLRTVFGVSSCELSSSP
ncbi:MAG: GxxExxY protein [Alphaproteobacteria bacterium]